ncbi:protoglobin domain-containing protein [Sphingobium yanoikuyae]|uniref:Globin-sensor domain-containing protein n=1 Tax=Sphingobium yanoikuyae TaxID=13690 RepID=A0A9X7UI27_SPHYA|nr:protoglobin domain-containing protein [Sphingobium yanoikuyae]QNG48397.1 hypothetical protein H3V42_13105 [Sphingobium yanoikuyae]
MFTDEERIKGSAKLPAHSRHSHAPLKLLAEMAAEHGRELVALFYDTLLRDQEAAQFLNHAVVQERLSSSLIEWLTQLFSGQDIRDSPEKQARQKIIGEVHARIKIPVHLVMTGALVIKTRLAELLQGQAVDPLVGIRALQLADARMDTAVMLISQSYVKDTTARARLDEAYRLFSLDQDAAVDKETQRASLMEWSQNTLFALLQAGPGGGLLRLGDSAFGLWLRHRHSSCLSNRRSSALWSDLSSASMRCSCQSWMLPVSVRMAHPPWRICAPQLTKFPSWSLISSRH